jgi:hypothetical protein
MALILLKERVELFEVSGYPLDQQLPHGTPHTLWVLGIWMRKICPFVFTNF